MEISGYTVRQCIAEGGMAAAYLAEQTSLGRTVVLKVLDTSVNDSRLALRRFMNEGQLLAALRHPNVITVYDIGSASNFVYISMEYVAGGDLKRRLAGGPLPPGQALDILTQVARGLGAAHAEGIVHRDVKPGNILFRPDGTPLLSDFGIAKSLTRDVDLTATGVFLGSPNYMAPEQAEPGEIDTRADIYALGVIFHEMLTGQKPYQSESVIEVIHMHRTAPIPRLPPALAVFQSLLDIMLAKRRNDRFRDVPALLHHVEQIRQRWQAAELAAITGAAPPESRVPVRLHWDQPSDRRLRIAMFALLGLALAGHGALFVLEANLEAPPAAPVSADVSQLAATRAELQADRPAAESAGPVDPAEVVAALLWLGTHSLNAQRLTMPPNDNAYYFFSRALQLEPGNRRARAGLGELARRYALLADNAVVAGDLPRARAYLAIGREIDPDNEALRVIGELAAPRAGVWHTLTRWFGGKG
jgi:serine/threonine-protein kinase PpkA